jgi:hypothetical protein
MAGDSVSEGVDPDETTVLNTASDHGISISYGTLNELVSTVDEETPLSTNTERAESPTTSESDERSQISGKIWSVISVLLLGASSPEKRPTMVV